MNGGGPSLCVSALLRREARVLLVERGRAPQRGQTALPGGRVEPGESLAGALAREVLEETGLAVRCGRLLGIAERHEPQGDFVVVCFEAVDLDPAREAVAGDDAAAVRWVAPERLSSEPLAPGVAALLRDAGVLAG